VVDVHTHAWPDSIAERALAGTFKDLHIFGDGKISTLTATMDASGINRAVCLAVANTGAAVESANRFVGSLDRERFVGFGSVHPELTPRQNIESLRRHRLCGVKLHPLFQNYGLDDPSLLRTLDELQGEFVALVHVGAGNEQARQRCRPTMLREIVERCPGLDVIACHFGGFRMLDEAEAEIIGLPVYLDTAWPPTVGEVDADRVRGLIVRHGADRVLFGSDWPMASPAAEIEALRALDLPDDQCDALLGGNAERLIARYEGRQ
jgi:predicted TIM-barrel fold metal-dependent hydrolase